MTVMAANGVYGPQALSCIWTGSGSLIVLDESDKRVMAMHWPGFPAWSQEDRLIFAMFLCEFLLKPLPTEPVE